MVKQIRERIQPALMLILRRFGLQASPSETAAQGSSAVPTLPLMPYGKHDDDIATGVVVIQGHVTGSAA